jgi:predicted ATPase
MARLWRGQRKRQQAHELLAPSWFTEGFYTRDLKEGKALLAELAARRRSRPTRESVADWPVSDEMKPRAHVRCQG